MHSNLISPPDYIQIVLIYNATKEEIDQVGAALHEHEKVFNVYVYNDDMNNLQWFDMMRETADVLLYNDTTKPINSGIGTLLFPFGPYQEYKTPASFFK